MNTSAAKAPGPVVLALDVGSSGSRGGLFDATGAEVSGARGKVRHAFTTATDGTSIIDADQIVAEVSEIIDGVLAQARGVDVGGVAIDTFSSSLVGIDADGAATTPCFTYADSRCGPQVAALREELDETGVQQRTGTRLHSSYTAPRLRWLAAEQPDVFARTTTWLTLGEYVYLRLTGTTAVGTAAAAWSGMLDRTTGEWDPAMLQAAGIEAGALGQIRDPDDPLPPSDRAGARWPQLREAVWFGVIGDGLAANIGAGADAPGVFGVSAATSGAMRALVPSVPQVPAGLWCYRAGAGRFLLGGAVSDLGRLSGWAQRTLRIDDDGAKSGDGSSDDGASHDDVLADILTRAPQEATPLALPFLSGERSTGWATSAQAHLLGLSAASTGAQMYRGIMEAGALSLARIFAELRHVAGVPERIVASGGFAKTRPQWLQILADALDAPVVHVTHKRSTLRGTAHLALEHLAPGIDRAPARTGATYEPLAGHRAYYRERAERFESAYRALI